jgi:cell division protein FtsL
MARTEYMRGNTVRREYQPAPYRGPVPVQNPSGQKKRRSHMSLGYLLFLSLAMVMMVGTLAWYISLQSQVKNTSKSIASLESQLNTLRQENDEAYNRANGKVDLEEVKRIAISEYGMTYATEGQIITYSDGGGNDYVRQVAPIPQSDN